MNPRIWAITVIDYPACTGPCAIYCACRHKRTAPVTASKLRAYVLDYVQQENHRLPFRGYPRKTKILGRFSEEELIRRVLGSGISLIGRAVQCEEKTKLSFDKRKT